MLESDAAADALQLTPRPRGLSSVLMRHVARCDAGRLTIETPSGKVWSCRGSNDGPDARLTIHRWRALARLLVGGDLGFAEAYRLGDWTSPDLAAFFAWVTANEQALSGAWSGAAALRAIDRLRHARRANTKRGSRRNIAAHYDLGNDFYAAWLDDGMNYSSGLYLAAGESLEDAQRNKLDRVVEYLNLPPDAKVLDIGCGWGALVERLAKRAGRHVTGVTVSAEQRHYAQRRLEQGGLSDRAHLRFQDYRDLDGQFDGIVSIEMLEAVGERYWPVYFQKLRDLLKPGGHAVLQVITISDDRFASYRARPDFIQRFIFPGGMLPTKTHMRDQAAKAGLALVAEQYFPLSYAATLAEWRRRFDGVRQQLEPMGYDENFCRLWEYYLAYCETGFRCGALDVGFYVLK